MEGLKKTPLYATHVKHGGRIVDFGGWALPVQFSGIKEEHLAVRNAAGLFDVSHMGEFIVQGMDALALVQRVTCNDIAKGFPGRVIYSPMCNERGGVVDDLMACCLEDGGYMLVVNAANIEKDFDWVTSHARGMSVTVRNVSAETGEVALQGPNSQAILQRLTDTDLSGMKYYRMKEGARVAGIRATVARTGYTGEDGFEVYCDAEYTPDIWDAIMDAGGDYGIVPCGLGARDTLRFEASMPLYGHELDDERTPLEAGLERFVSFDKGDYIGREALARQKAEGVKLRLIGFETVDRGGVPRAGYPVVCDGSVVGKVTSGNYSPTFDKNLGMAYVPAELAEPGRELGLDVRGRILRIRVVPLPFYKRGARK
ncbi:MAG: glycine cleavage system aminomethyltransferase GcvT [Firmicutes bacterium]|nr:glycine cleavage system aminomethyltransferase GcvT [Bacillota bacterium]